MAVAPNLPPQLFDRGKIAKRVANSWTGSPDFISQLVADDLLQRLLPIKRKFDHAAILGPDPRILPQKAESADGPVQFKRYSTLVPVSGFEKLDAEHLDLTAGSFDLIVSLLDLQMVNDVPGYLSRIRHALKPDGLMITAAIGGRSLTELRAAWLRADAEILGGANARVAPFMDVRDAGSLLQRAGYALPVADVETHNIRYAAPLSLMLEIKALGAANPLTESYPKMATRTLLEKAIEAYPIDADGRVTATLEIVWLSGWSPHESQQKPLKPGSAQTSLHDVLGKKPS